MTMPIDPSRARSRLGPTVVAQLLTRVAKHLALLACLSIVGAINQHIPIGQVTIFALIVVAAIVHSISHGLTLTERRTAHQSRHGP